MLCLKSFLLSDFGATNLAWLITSSSRGMRIEYLCLLSHNRENQIVHIGKYEIMELWKYVNLEIWINEMMEIRKYG